jgi:hypothetical protein
MHLTALPLPPEIWAATPCAARALIMARQERVRALEARLGRDLAAGVAAVRAAAPAVEGRDVVDVGSRR